MTYFAKSSTYLTDDVIPAGAERAGWISSIKYVYAPIKNCLKMWFFDYKMSYEHPFGKSFGAFDRDTETNAHNNIWGGIAHKLLVSSLTP